MWEESSTCSDLETYLRINKFPFLIKLNSGYIKKLQNENRILFLFALSNVSNDDNGKLSQTDISFCEFKKLTKIISKKNRDIIFSFFDIDQDSYLSNFFKLNKSKVPCLIIYDFSNRKYIIDYSDYKSIDSFKENVLNMKLKLETNNIQWIHGNWIQDFLSRIGINLSERGSLIFLGCIFIAILIILIIVLFCFGDGNDEEFELQKKEFMEKLAASTELHEEEKKLILGSKNFDSLVRMGIDKIIENLKGSLEQSKDLVDEEEEEDPDIIREENKEENNKEVVDNLNSINDIKNPREKLQIKKNN